MLAREAIARVLIDMPAAVVRWAGAPVERLPRTPTGIAALDEALSGGWPRSRVSVLKADRGLRTTGRTTIAAATVARATRGGHLACWIDAGDELDPVSLAAAGADLGRVLWVRGPLPADEVFATAEEVVMARGFEVIVVNHPRGRLCGRGATMSPTWLLRLSRAVERGRAVMLFLEEDEVSIPGSLELRLGSPRGLWAGAPGTSLLLTGARVGAETGDRRVEMVFKAQVFP